MLEICLALPTFYPSFGGGSLRFLRYQPGLRARGIEARVLAGTVRAKDATPAEIDLGWHQHPIGARLPLEHVEGIPVHRVRLPDRTGVRRTSTYFRALLELCRADATRPDVIQVHSFERLESLYWLRRLRRLGIPMIYAIQIARPAEESNPLARRAHERMLRGFYGVFDGVVTSSEQIRDYFCDIGVRVPIAVIPNGVDLERHRPASAHERGAARRRLGLAGDGPVVLSVGAVSPRKGTDLLVEAFARLAREYPDARLVVVGPRHDRRKEQLGASEARLAALVQRCPRPERILFTGLREDLPDFYAAADVLVLPTDREGGTPNAVLEAMACDRPVLLTPFEGQSRAIGRPGIDFEQVPRTVEDLADGLIRLLADERRRQDLVRSAREHVVARLDVERSIDRFAELYRHAAAGTLCEQTIACPEPAPLPAAGSEPAPRGLVSPVASALQPPSRTR